MKKRISQNFEFVIIFCSILSAAGFVYYELDNSAPIFLLAAVLIPVAAFAVYVPAKAQSAANFCFHHRWAIAFLVFVFCLILRISGSSIGIYDEYLPTQIHPSDATWFGKVRAIRSDEFGIQTPMFFSQAFNDHALYSSRMSLSPTNMVLNYYSPVWDVTAVGKPLMWGYLLFGNEIGLSWYWCGMIILLFMAALEMLLILTERCRWASVIGAAMIVLSPAIQWWVMPHMPVVILYAMALFCVGYYFFTAENVCGKWGFAALAVITAVGFALSIFPSFQVPCAYAVVVLLAFCLRRDRDRIAFRAKEWYRIAMAAAVALGILLYFAMSSKNDLSLLMNTVYPGKRVDTGGTNTIRDLFTDLTSLFLPYRDIPYANNCEVSTYIHFAPLIFVLFPQIFIFLKRKCSSERWVGMALTVLTAICAFYMCVGISPVLAKVTLLKYCNRMKSIYGWLATLYTVWGLTVLFKYPDLLKRWQKILYPIAYAAACFLLVDENTVAYFESFGVIKNIPVGTVLLVGEIILLSAILMTAFLGRRRLTACWLLIVMVVSGAVVNPVEHGTEAMTNHPASSSISKITKQEPDALWLCTDCSFIMSNYVMANGARVINATNFYPDVAKWERIDPEGVYDEVTNRYANQSSFIADGQVSEIELVLPDYIYSTLTPETLRELNVNYLFSRVDYTELLRSHDIACRYIAGQDGYGIYHLNY